MVILISFIFTSIPLWVFAKNCEIICKTGTYPYKFDFQPPLYKTCIVFPQETIGKECRVD